MGSDLVDEFPRRVGREHEVVDRAGAARVLLVDVLLARDAKFPLPMSHQKPGFGTTCDALHETFSRGFLSHEPAVRVQQAFDAFTCGFERLPGSRSAAGVIPTQQ